eukprot:6192994-Alexandrium_andersonii.AAC.1
MLAPWAAARVLCVAYGTPGLLAGSVARSPVGHALTGHTFLGRSLRCLVGHLGGLRAWVASRGLASLRASGQQVSSQCWGGAR